MELCYVSELQKSEVSLEASSTWGEFHSHPLEHVGATVPILKGFFDSKLLRK